MTNWISKHIKYPYMVGMLKGCLISKWDSYLRMKKSVYGSMKYIKNKTNYYRAKNICEEMKIRIRNDTAT